MAELDITLKRAYDPAAEDDGYRVPLVPPAPVKPAPALATP